MNSKRWWALLIAGVLFLISIGFQAFSSKAVIDSAVDEEFSQTVIEKGALTKKIAVLSLEGVIQDTGEGSLLSQGGYNHQEFLKMLDEAADDDMIKGIILRVNTPGGSVVESAEIQDKIVKIKKETKKPIYVSMGTTAASGGYYIAAPADKIFANPATITGSIGVIMQAINYSELAKDFGVDFNTIKSGKYKDIMSPTRAMTEDERVILQEIIDDMYGDFVKVIVDGRGMPEDQVRALADGRIYTGKQAKTNGLVDEVGSLTDTIAMMEADHNIKDASVIKYEAKADYWKKLVSMSAQSVSLKNKDLLSLLEVLKASDGPQAMYLYSN